MPEPALAGWLAALLRLLPATVRGFLKKFPDPSAGTGRITEFFLVLRGGQCKLLRKVKYQVAFPSRPRLSAESGQAVRVENRSNFL
ncbi:MAG TPA: hypothetical protein DCS85_10965, partial [Verrucomicrobiales bacterium]|nr:hypothetical protein [Verrucomicrobiales bacterium]